MKGEKRQALRAHILNLLAALPPLAWAAAFVLWAFTQPRKELPALFTGAALCLLGALATIRTVARLRAEAAVPVAEREKPFVPESRADRYDRRHPTGRILLFALITRAALIAALYCIDRRMQGGYAGGIFDRIPLWNNGLFTSSAGQLISEPAETLLSSLGPGCYPLFPMIASAIAPAFPEPFFAGMAVSNLFTVIAAPFLYELVLLDGNVHDAKRALVLLLLSPFSVFFLYANEASLVLAFGSAALLCSRRHKPFLAALCAFFAILSHPVSIVLILPLVWDRFSEIALDRALGIQRSFIKRLLPLFFVMLSAIGLMLPVLVCEFKTGSLPEAVKELAGIPFFEETALRVTRLSAAFPEERLERIRVLIPVIVPALPLLAVLVSAKRLRAQYALTLMLSIFSLSVLSLRDALPALAGSALFLSCLSAFGKRLLTKILVILVSVAALALCVYALGTGMI